MSTLISRNCVLPFHQYLGRTIDADGRFILSAFAPLTCGVAVSYDDGLPSENIYSGCRSV